MIIKITGPDGTFDLIGRVKRCSFRRNQPGTIAILEREGGETEEHAVIGSAYVLNEDGKTIDQFHSSRN